MTMMMRRLQQRPSPAKKCFQSTYVDPSQHNSSIDRFGHLCVCAGLDCLSPSTAIDLDRVGAGLLFEARLLHISDKRGRPTAAHHHHNSHNTIHDRRGSKATHTQPRGAVLDGAWIRSSRSGRRDRYFNYTPYIIKIQRPILLVHVQITHQQTRPAPAGGAPVYTPLDQQHAAASPTAEEEGGGGGGGGGSASSSSSSSSSSHGGRQAASSFKPFGVRRISLPPSNRGGNKPTGGEGGGNGEDGAVPLLLEEGGGGSAATAAAAAAEDGDAPAVPSVVGAAAMNQAPLWSCVAVLANNMMGAGASVRRPPPPPQKKSWREFHPTILLPFNQSDHQCDTQARWASPTASRRRAGSSGDSCSSSPAR
jgi:hypothetical protein